MHLSRTACHRCALPFLMRSPCFMRLLTRMQSFWGIQKESRWGGSTLPRVLMATVRFTLSAKSPQACIKNSAMDFRCSISAGPATCDSWPMVASTAATTGPSPPCGPALSTNLHVIPLKLFATESDRSRSRMKCQSLPQTSCKL